MAAITSELIGYISSLIFRRISANACLSSVVDNAANPGGLEKWALAVIFRAAVTVAHCCSPTPKG